MSRDIIDCDSANFTATIVDAINEGVAVYDRQLRYAFVSPFFERASGFSSDELVGRKVTEVFPHLLRERWQEAVRRALDGETVESTDRKWKFSRRDEPIWIRTTYGPFKNADGEIIGVLAVVRDVTERKRAEEAQLQLAREEAQHAQAKIARQQTLRLLDSIGDPFLAVDADWKVTYINEKAASYWSISRDDLIDKCLWDVFPADEAADLRDALDRALRHRERTTFETVSVVTDRWLEVSAFPFEDGLSIYFRDIQPRKDAEKARERYERSLVVAKRKAEEMEQLKSSMLANMSHEIRTPLTSIILQAELLRRQLDDIHHEDIARLVRSSQRLGETIDSVLTLAKIESKTLALEPRPIDLAAEVSHVVDELEPLAAQKNVPVHFNAAETTHEHICLDATAIRRIVTNLVDNAIKFTDDGEVSVSVRQDEQRARIEVRDTGIGISESMLANLFEPFKQASMGLSRKYEGSGLGLAVVKELVEILGGDIEVSSERGVGSCFRVSLPVIYNDGEDGDGGELDAPPPSTPSGVEVELPVLIVDDNTTICDLIASFLSPRTAHIAHTAEDALELVEKNRYAAILMDISLPKLDGVQALKELRSMKGDASPPVIAMTGHALPGDQQRFLSEGFDAYMAKPFSPDALTKKLDALLQHTS
ncbi:MAG: PAS domain-containing protein [Persicimonas sp.]